MMQNNNIPYGEFEYGLMMKKLDDFCGKLSNKMIFEELSREVKVYSEEHSIQLWNEETSKGFILHISNKWESSYCATLAVESVLKELSLSFPQTTFTHISKTLSELTN